MVCCVVRGMICYLSSHVVPGARAEPTKKAIKAAHTPPPPQLQQLVAGSGCGDVGAGLW